MHNLTPRRWGTPVIYVILLFLLGSVSQPALAQSNSEGDNAWTIRRNLSVVADLEGVRFVSEGNSVATDFPTGTVLWATGRSSDSQYLYVQTSRETEGEQGWIATADVVAFGVNLIPTRDLPDTVASALKREPETSTAPSSRATSASGDTEEATEEDSAEDSAEDAESMEAASESSGSSDESSTETAYVVPSGLNVRSGPGIEFNIVTQASRGDELTVIDRSADGQWLSISLPSAGVSGWVSAQFVSADQAAASSGPSAGSALSSGSGGILVFQQSIGGQIYVYDLSQGALRSLTAGSEPAISPDRSTVAFSRSDGLYLIDIDGTNERLLFSGREGLGSPKWSPDGNTLIFTRGDEWQACVKRGPREVCSESSTVGEGKYKKIMYAIAAVEADGSNYRDVVSTKPARAPDWTEAGIVYQSIDGLQLTNADRDAVNTLIDYDYLDPFYYDPDRQPGGGQIVFQSKEGSHWQIFTINADGSGRRALTRPQTALVDQLPSSVAPAFSPDGQQIVFLSNRTPSGEAGDWTMWIMNADGSNQYQLPVNVSIDYTYGVEQVVSWR